MTIVDALPGKGKTESLIKLMDNASKDERFLFVTPYLREVDRIKRDCKNRRFYEPDTSYGRGSKYADLQNMLSRGWNVASTHSLFLRFNETTESIIKAKGYNLVLDESVAPVQTRKIKKDDFDVMVRDGSIEVDENHFIRWKKPNYDGDYYDWMKYFAERGCLLLSSSESKKDKDMEVTVWIYPIEVFRAFRKIYIATYKIKGSLLDPYLKMYGMDYDYKSMDDNYNIVPYSVDIEIADRKRVSQLINIYQGDNLNAVGEDYYALSKTWFGKPENQPLVKILKDNLYNWFRNIHDVKSDRTLWTTFTDYKNVLKGDGYTKGYISCNERATNDYRSRDKLAYCINRFEVPTYKNIFLHNGVKVDEDELALSDEIQWLFRGAIRDGKPIDLYIPSSRMRGILTTWLNP